MPAAPSSRGAALTCRSWLIGCVILLLAMTVQGVEYKFPFQTGTDLRFFFEYVSDHELNSVAPLVDRCRDAYNGTLVAADTEEMYEAMKVAVQQYYDLHPWPNRITVVLGGSFTDGNCPSGGTTYCPYCWDNGQRNCAIGDNNLFALAKKDNKAAYIHTRGYNGWKGSKAPADSKKPYVCYSVTQNAWVPCGILTDDIMMCVRSSKETPPLTNPPGETGSGSASETGVNGIPVSPTAKKSLWWISLIVLAVVLVVVIIIVCVVCRCCCGAGAPVEEEYKPEDDGRLSSVRDTRSNRSLVSRGGSMRSMSSRRGSAYSASQCDSQGDVVDYNSYGNRCASQGRSADSYY